MIQPSTSQSLRLNLPTSSRVHESSITEIRKANELIADCVPSRWTEDLNRVRAHCLEPAASLVPESTELRVGRERSDAADVLGSLAPEMAKEKPDELQFDCWGCSSLSVTLLNVLLT